MDDANQSGFKLPPEFQEDARAPLIEPNPTDSTELWFIQWPKDQPRDFDGQPISLDLNHVDGQLGSFEGSSVGKITRRVSFVRYLEASEVPKEDAQKLKPLYDMSSATSLANSATPTKSRKSRSCVSEEKKDSKQSRSNEEKKAKRKKHMA